MKTFTPEEFTTKPKEYLYLIDDQFLIHKRQGLSRYSESWGLWSVEMNKIIRHRIEVKKDPESTGLKYVFLYWMTKSQELELYHKNKLLHMSKKRKLAKEALMLKRIILTEDYKRFKLPENLQDIIRSRI